MQDIGNLLASAVIFLFAQNASGQVPIGTAFIVGYPIPGDPNRFVPLVVTAKHVVGDHQKVFGRFSTKKGKNPAFVEYDLSALRKDADYWEHTDRGVDIVVFRTRHFEQVQYNVVPMDLIASRQRFKDLGIQTTDRVVLPGLLVNFMGLARNFPIIRNGTIAMMPDEQIPMRYPVGSKVIETRQEAILIDSTAIPGQSGSPVFLWPGPRLQGGTFAVGGTQPLVLGVLHGFYPSQPRPVVTAELSKQVFAENSNIAIVFPSWRLREILESTPLTVRIDGLIKSGKD